MRKWGKPKNIIFSVLHKENLWNRHIGSEQLHNFVEQAKNIKPDYVSMITPARWYVGGKGLDTFRTSMINDDHIIKLVDYPNCYDVFPTVDIAGGISYFLWDNSANGECEVINCYNGKRDTLSRRLNEYDVFLRSNKAVNIVNKVRKIHDGKSIYV